jgi:acyl-CoA synthetase (AMP-forming)/AMP-acid ligase II
MTPAATLADLLGSADLHQTAILLPQIGPISRADLASQIGSLAALLGGSGLAGGERIAIVLPNGLEYLACFLAVAQARFVAAPLNPAYKAEEFRFYLEDAGARAVIAPAGDHPVREVARTLGLPIWTASLHAPAQVRLEGDGLGPTREPQPPRPEDVALFLHTSGTTSRPKGVPLTHANLMTSLGNIGRHYALGPGDVGLVVMPLFHVHGLLGATLAPLLAGGAVVVPPRFSAAAFWPAVREHSVTWYSAVPTIHQVLLSRADADEAPHNPGFRFIRSCSSALAPATMQQLESRFGAPVLEAYAMTEASHQMTANPLPPGARKPGSVGRGAGVDVSIMDDAGNLLPAGQPGEVVVRGGNVMSGYHNNPDANATAFTHGWFRTGDRGVLDGEGYVTLIGRIKELINRGGEKISPLEVDAALLAHPAVAEAASFAAPDPKYGEEVHAAVVLRSDATPEELRAFCAGRLADFKVPKVFYIVKGLPKGPTGKVQRRHLAGVFAASQPGR